MAPLTITIQTFSDTVCPWCYIGKKNLDRAIEIYKEEHPDVQFDITWTPFYLYPKAKVSAYNRMEYFLAKFGPAYAPGFFARVEEEAAALGLTMNWEGKCGNTRDSHILLLLAARQEQQQEQQQHKHKYCPPSASSTSSSSTLLDLLADALFKGAFEQGRDISDRAFLVETALRVGLKVSSGRNDGKGNGKSQTREEALLAWLDSEEARAGADALDRYAKEDVGITAVPSYIVQGRYRVGGKQSPEVFLRLFERIRSARPDGE